MAALADSPSPRTVDLRSIDLEILAPVIDEQILSWKTELNWDFTTSASLVRRFVQMRALNGYAVVSGRQVVGYSYYVCEDNKGLIGDLYVLKRHRSFEFEQALFQSTLDAMWQTPGVHRVESQLLMLMEAARRRLPYPNWFQAFPRLFLEAPLPAALPPRELPLSILPWAEHWQEATGRLIAHSYEGHVDSRINDQYRSAAGARRFLINIVQYPGCGTFFAPGSFVATDRGALCGVSLASLVAPDVGHITQVCVAPSYQSTGLGYELMRQSMAVMAAHGCRAVSLTVTAANQSALRLYLKMGFVQKRGFSAYVWEPGPIKVR
jgi:ribosomal protein S18 acetylase RimI-like enzyme